MRAEEVVTKTAHDIQRWQLREGQERINRERLAFMDGWLVG